MLMPGFDTRLLCPVGVLSSSPPRTSHAFPSNHLPLSARCLQPCSPSASSAFSFLAFVVCVKSHQR